MAQPLRALFLFALIFGCFEVRETAAVGAAVDGKKTPSVFEAPKLVSPDSSDQPASSSSSRRWRAPSSAGDDEAEIISMIDSPATKFEVPLTSCDGLFSNLEEHDKPTSIIPFEYALYERYPLDLLAQKNPQYLSYLKSKPIPKSSARASSSPIARKLAKFSPNQLEKCLKLKNCSMWEAVKIIESPAFDGLQLDYLNELPMVYMKRRVLEPFKAFLRRFKYQNESEAIFGKTDDIESEIEIETETEIETENRFTTPFAILVMKFSDPVLSSDILLDPFFKFIVESQSDAFEPLEWFFFDVWLKDGQPSWRFLKYYFDLSRSETKTESLIKVLINPNYYGPLTRDLIQFLLTIESFDINARVHYSLSHKTLEMQPTSFLHILVFESHLSFIFLPFVLCDPRLDITVPTGKITLALKYFDLTYTDAPIVFLAAIICNYWAIIHLHLNGRIYKSIRSDKFAIFVLSHIFRVLWLVLVYIFEKYYKMICDILRVAASKATFK